MADRSIKHPVRVLEDIPVMIDQYFIQGDFVVLDIEENIKVFIILGRPFLATAGAIIDVKRRKLVMEVVENNVEFNIFKMTKHQPSYVDECHMIDDMVECSAEVRENKLGDMQAILATHEPPGKKACSERCEKFLWP
ncbi:uncharacterized protein LOC116003908 [Ipomoea triloba]|uniref:uncharacterized protein LOC116003908 n=1 Tax=Ipomoea triloba TaxID=35885 RepID=UPI00125D9394|nr:uncharacterized protein LOC116003908 [Ipomoea triloba]